MAILTQVTQLIDGIDTVVAKDIMDTQETAINANNNASSAVSTANTAVSTANYAEEVAQQALDAVLEAGGAILYDTTGENTDGAMTQKAVTDNCVLQGGTLTAPLTVTGGDSATAGKVILTNDGNITDESTRTLLGRSGDTTLYCGHPKFDLQLRGAETRPFYNGNEMAMLSDVLNSQYLKYNVPFGTEIPASIDLNSIEYIKVDSYYCSTNANVQTLTNCPVDIAFMMEVVAPLDTTINNESTSTWVYRLRKLTTHLGDVYYQHIHSSGTAGTFTYSDWYKVSNINSNAISTFGDKQGCVDLPNGTRIIYGYVSSVTQDGSTSVTFYGGYKFASNPIVMLTSYSGTRSTWTYFNGVGISSTSTTGFTLYSRDYGFGRYYLAIGKSPLTTLS